MRIDTRWPHPVEFHGNVEDVKILHDDTMLEIFINGGQSVFSLHLE